MTDPVKEDRTIYDAFIAGEARNAAGSVGDGGKQRGTHSQPASKKRKPEQNGKRETVSKPVALDAALAQVLNLILFCFLLCIQIYKAQNLVWQGHSKHDPPPPPHTHTNTHSHSFTHSHSHTHTHTHMHTIRAVSYTHLTLPTMAVV